MKKNSKGITLVALIITIIILLILAGISIATLTNTRLFKNVKLAKEKEEISQALEELKIKIMEVQTQKNGNANLEDIITYFKNDNENEYIISLNSISSINGEIPNVEDAKEIYVIYKKYQFKIDANLNVEFIDKYTKNDDNEIFITYDANGGNNEPKKQTKNNNVISNIKPVRDNYIFLGWGTSKDALHVSYKAGDVYTGNKPITLYALWGEKREYIENNGYSYIDTDFCADQDTKIEFVAETNICDTSSRAWFGCRSDVTTNSNVFCFWNIDTTFRSDYDKENNKIDNINVETNKKYTIVKDKNITYINGIKLSENTYNKFNVSSTLTLFSIKTYNNSEYNDFNSIDKGLSNLRLYSCKIWDNDKIVRNFIPINFNGKDALFDLANYKVYYLKNTINNIEYIDSNGKQYIDTGFCPDQNTSIELMVEPLNNSTISGWFGSRNDFSSSEDNSFSFWQINNNFRSDYNSIITTIDKIKIDKNIKYKINKTKNITLINDIKYVEEKEENFKSAATLTLFGIKTYKSTNYNLSNSVDNRMAEIRLYYCKIWNNDILIRNFVPVTDIENTACLLDTVNNKLYYNLGAGNFAY